MQRRPFFALAALAPLLALPPAAFGHGAAGHAAKPPAAAQQTDWGIAAPAARATRTVTFTMGDDMRFTPATLQVRRGETLRIVVRNNGRLMHEFVLGTPAENAKHAEMMKKFPNMEHDEPWMAHVEPGRTGEIAWNFNRAGVFEFACLVAGHYDAGMAGRIEVTP